MARIYVASSWRNQYFPEVVKKLREYGHEVWKDVDPDFDEDLSIRLQSVSSKPILMP